MKRLRKIGDEDVGPLGRRAHSRLHVRLPARALTLKETRPAVLRDISVLGAQIETDAAVLPGAEVLLQWDRFDAFGEVVWVDRGRCGIIFREMIPIRTLIATRNLDDRDRLPSDRDALLDHTRHWVEGKLRY